jgi:Carboxypeptidase regulatory-like domain
MAAPGLVVWALVAILIPTVAAASQGRATADLSGVVFDPQGAVVPAAAVTARNVATNITRKTVSNENGEYAFPGLVAGTYEITVEARGFDKAVRADIELSVGQAATLDVTLTVSGVSQIITVSSSPLLVNTVRTEQSQRIAPVTIAALPVNGRNFFDFSLLTPNVSRGRANLNTPLVEPGISFAGLRGQFNNISVDGLDNNDAYNGSSRATISQEAVQEFRVVNNSFGADAGRALGGLVNVVTKSGGNTRHGSAFVFLRDDRFDARSILTPADQNSDLRQQQFGGTFSGPITRDVLFAFASYEGQRRRQRPQYSTFILTNIDDINARLATFGFPSEAIDEVKTSNNYDQALGKVHGQTGQTLVTARYNVTNARNPNLGVGGIALPSNGRRNAVTDHSGAVTAVTVFSPTMVNDLRAQIAHRRFDNRPVVALPNLLVAGLLVAGNQFDQIDTRSERRLQIADSVTLLGKGHTVKFGGEANFVHDDMNFFAFGGGRVVFAGINGFLNTANDPAGFTAGTFQVGVGDPNTSVSQPTIEAFVQDEWRVHPRVTLNYGLRYTVDLVPTEMLDRDYDNFQPRTGVAYALDASSKTMVSAGYGIFVNTFPILQHINPRLFGGRNYSEPRNQLDGQVLIHSISGAGATPAAVAYLNNGTIPAAAPQFAIPANRHVANPYSHQASLLIERQLGDRLVVRGGYVYTRGANLNRIQNINLLAPVATLPSGKPDFQFRAANPAFSAVTEYNSNGHSRYHGATVTLEKRLSQRFAFTLNYTGSKATDDTVNFSFQNSAENEFAKELEWARSVEHVPHRFTAFGLLDAPETGALRGFRLAGTVVAESGRFFNVTVGADANRDFNAQTDRPFLVGRNTLQGPAYFNVDLRVSKSLTVQTARLELIFEVFNLFNRVNVQNVNGVWGTGEQPIASYGTPNAVFNPRQVQLAFRASF